MLDRFMTLLNFADGIVSIVTTFDMPQNQVAAYMSEVKSHQVNDFCEHNNELCCFYEGKLYCKACAPNVEGLIKIFNNDYECAICRDATYLDIIYDCGHMFCQECVNNIEKTSPDCPICRK
jgi:hypothetical protein